MSTFVRSSAHMRVILTVLLIVCSYFAKAQPPFVRDFSLSETNAPVKVNALQQGAIGYLWLGTDNGLFRYNGSKFVKIQDSIHKPVTAIAIVGKTVWIGYSNGKIGVVADQVVRLLPVRNGPSSSITSLHAAGKGLLIAGTEEQGLFVILNGIAMPFNTANGLSDDFVYDFVVAGNRLLAATDEGINDVSLSGKKISVNKYTTRDGLPDNIVSCISKIPGTRLYLIGTQEKGIAIYDDENKTINSILDEGEEWAYGQVNDILPVAGYRAWATTEDGYLLEIKMNNGTAECHPVHYPGKSLEKLLLDRAGNIWCGTSKGLMMITGEYLRDIRLAPLIHYTM